MERRDFLARSGVIGSIVLAGCSDSDDSGESGGSGGSTNSPTTVVRNYLQTLYGGTVAEINAYLHPNAETPEFTEAQTRRYEGSTLQVDNVEQLSRDGDTAEVSASITVDTGGQTLEDTATYELRKANGKWKVYHIES